MRPGRFPVVGRDRELAALAEALAEAHAGAGSLWLISGEAGIGKSRLTDELARSAQRQGTRVVFGRCWEEGGAPPHWPFIQVLRALMRELGEDLVAPEGAGPLAQLVPELARERPSFVPLSAEEARFQLLDALASAVCRAASRAPLLVVLEDLHAADHASLVTLDFLARQLRGVRVLLVGTYRDAELRRSEAAPLLLRLAQEAHVLPLGRLARADVAAFVREAFDDATDELIALVEARTEGNPLFVLELTRLLVQQGSHDLQRARAVPPTVRTTLEARLAELPEPAREALELASVMGREVRVERLGDAFGRDASELRRALERAEPSGLLLQPAPGAFRFAHTLVREVAHDAIAVERRAELHLRLGTHLACAAGRGDAQAWSEAAHHLFLAGGAGLDGAIEAALRAAEQATAQLAFEVAATLAADALEVLQRAGETRSSRVARLLIAEGCARLRSGQLDAGRALALRAAELARTLGDSELLAEAALSYGSVLLFAQVDRRLVDLLEEASRALGTRESALRARVLTRLAAALQPAPDPRGPIALAREGIAIAQRLGDPATLLSALRDGGSAMVDLEDAELCLPYHRQHAQLATQLGAHADTIRARTRLAMNLLELGQLDEGRAEIHTLCTLARTLGHPGFLSRARAFDATLALWEGRFDDAEQAISDGLALGQRGGDPNAHETATYQRMRLYRLAGRRAELEAHVALVAGLFRGTPTAEHIASAWSRVLLLDLGREDDALRGLSEGVYGLALDVGDPTMWEAVSELSHAAGERDVAERLRARLAPRRDRLITGGVIGLTIEGSVHRPLALASLTLGDVDAALGHFEDALATCRRLGGAPSVAWLAQEAATLALEHGAAASLERARAWLDESEELAARLGMRSVLERVTRAREQLGSAARSRPPVEEPTTGATSRRSAPAFALVREGDVVRVEHGPRTHRLRDSKGLQILSRLVAEPGREVHVLDLIDAPAQGDAPRDLGDAGEVLDPRARAAYAARVRELDATIAQAEDWNDHGRLEAARAERDAIARELSRALGLGSRARRSGGAAERARVNVQRRVRDALRRIEEHDPELARHLSRAVRTGTFCSYEPE